MVLGVIDELDGVAGRDRDSSFGCAWHTVNDTVIAYGEALVDDDPGRLGEYRTI